MKTKSTSTPKRQRRPENDLLTVSLPKSLKVQLAEAARQDQRSVSNYLVRLLTRILYPDTTTAALDEKPREYGTDRNGD
jgi:hypothetical protein